MEVLIAETVMTLGLKEQRKEAEMIRTQKLRGGAKQS